MTRKQAQQEAQKRWGRLGMATVGSVDKRCFVGKDVPGSSFPEIYGAGETFEDAFAGARQPA